MAKTVFDQATRDELRRRMESIGATKRPLWGKMDAGQMLKHVNRGLEMALGDLPTQPKKGSPFANPVGRWLVIYALPWPKGAPTAPELLVTDAGDWDAELPRFHDLVERVGRRGPDGQWPVHPAFGRMKGRTWGDLQYKHVDHHLRQFGV